VILYYDPIYTNGLHPEARFPRERYRLLAERLGPYPGIELKRPAPITREDLIQDHLGHLNLTRQGLDRRNRMVFEWAERHRLPVVLFMGGGYATPVERSVDAFVDLFTVASEVHARRAAGSGS